MESGPLAPSPQRDPNPSGRFIVDPADILSKLRDPLEQFEFYVTDDLVKVFLNHFKDRLDQIRSHGHHHDEPAFRPTLH
jgi:hypothetical protein